MSSVNGTNAHKQLYSNTQRKNDAESFKAAIKNNITMGATQDEMLNFLMYATDKNNFKSVSATTKQMAISTAMEEVKQMTQLLTNAMRSFLQTTGSIISNLGRI